MLIRYRKGEYAPEYFTLRSIYFQGRPPKSVNMHWRRFKIVDIPYLDHEAFDKWVLDRWKEKDELLEQFYDTGRFPSDKVTDVKAGIENGYIETAVKLRSWLEIASVFVVLGTLLLASQIIYQLLEMFS